MKKTQLFPPCLPQTPSRLLRKRLYNPPPPPTFSPLLMSERFPIFLASFNSCNSSSILLEGETERQIPWFDISLFYSLSGPDRESVDWSREPPAWSMYVPIFHGVSLSGVSDFVAPLFSSSFSDPFFRDAAGFLFLSEQKLPTLVLAVIRRVYV